MHTYLQQAARLWMDKRNSCQRNFYKKFLTHPHVLGPKQAGNSAYDTGFGFGGIEGKGQAIAP